MQARSEATRGQGVDLQHLLIGARLVKWGELLPLQVLDQLEHAHARALIVTHDHRHLAQAGAPRRHQASAARDDDVVVGHAAHDERLEEAKFLDALRQLVEPLVAFGVPPIAPGLVGVALYLVDRHAHGPRHGWRRVRSVLGRRQRTQYPAHASLALFRGVCLHPGSAFIFHTMCALLWISIQSSGKPCVCTNPCCHLGPLLGPLCRRRPYRHAGDRASGGLLHASSWSVVELCAPLKCTKTPG